MRKPNYMPTDRPTQADFAFPSFDTLYENYSAALLGVALKILRNRAEAEEVLHDSFIKIWDNKAKYRNDRGRPFTWMARITKNCALDRIRSKQFRMRSITDSIEPLNKETLLGSCRQNDPYNLYHALTSKLAEKQTEVIDALFAQGMTQSQAADHLKIPIGTVKSRSRKAINEMRKILDYDTLTAIA